MPAAIASNPAIHLAWGDLSMDEGCPPSVIRIFLKCSKRDQFGQGVAVYAGATGNDLCLVAATLAYVAVCGSGRGSFFL